MKSFMAMVICTAVSSSEVGNRSQHEAIYGYGDLHCRLIIKSWQQERT
ncbi:hypothetical protein ACTG15_19835 [Aeromonas sp. 164P]